MITIQTIFQKMTVSYTSEKTSNKKIYTHKTNYCLTLVIGNWSGRKNRQILEISLNKNHLKKIIRERIKKLQLGTCRMIKTIPIRNQKEKIVETYSWVKTVKWSLIKTKVLTLLHLKNQCLGEAAPKKNKFQKASNHLILSEGLNLLNSWMNPRKKTKTVNKLEDFLGKVLRTEINQEPLVTTTKIIIITGIRMKRIIKMIILKKILDKLILNSMTKNRLT